jgi:hypothetical protein
MDRFDELLSDYLDGVLQPAERDELASLIDADSARRDTFVSMVREHRLLATELGDPASDPFARRVMAEVDKGRTQFVRAVMADLKRSGTGGKRPSPPLPPRRTFRPRGDQGPGWVLWVSMAAGLLVILAIVVSISGGDEPSKPDRRSVKGVPKPTKPESLPTPRSDLVKNPEPPPLPKPELPVPTKPEPREAPAPLVVKPEVKPQPEPNPQPVPKPEPVSPDKPPVTVTETAKLESVEGEVTLGTVAATPGPLSPGFILETRSEQSAAVFRYPDGTRVELAGLSKVQDEPTRVLGTKLRVETFGDSTRLDVTEGRVRLMRLRDKASVEVAAGHYAVAGPSGSMTSRLSRTSMGLVALYTFKEGKGGIVHDSSRVGQPLDLRIENESAVKWSPKGLQIGLPVLISSTAPATKIIQACKASNEVTVEAWVRPGTLTQSGKDSRIVGLSADIMNQDFLLGQDELKGGVHSYFMRLRTTTTDLVGKPALTTPDNSASLKLSHLVFVRSAAGVATFYVDGVDVARTAGGGALSNWNDAYRLSVGNELSGDRPWLGEVHLVSVFSRALTTEEVKQNLKAGSE